MSEIVRETFRSATPAEVRRAEASNEARRLAATEAEERYPREGWLREDGSGTFTEMREFEIRRHAEILADVLAKISKVKS